MKQVVKLNFAVLLRLALFVAAIGAVFPAHAATYRLAVPPFLEPDQLREIYAPLTRYLSDATGDKIELALSPNFPAYWQQLNSDRFDLVLDAAHLVDYRVHYLEHNLLAKAEGILSFSLVTGPNTFIFEPTELTGKIVATLPLPNMGAVQLDQLFPNPVRYPSIVEVATANEAVALIRQGKAVGAYIPTPMAGANPDLNTVLTTDPFPNMGMTARNSVPQPVQSKIRDALLSANDTEKGRKMLADSRIPQFEAADRSVYDGYNKWLKDMWGYKGAKK